MSQVSHNVWIVANTTWYIFNFRKRLIERLQAQGHRVTALSPKDDYLPRILTLGVQHVHLEMDNSGTNPLRDLVLICRLIHLFRRYRPGLLLTFTPKVNIYCSIAARQTGVPVVANVSGLGSGFIRGGLLGAIIKLLYRLALRYPRRVFFQNEDDLGLFATGKLVPQASAELLPGSGVDVERFAPALSSVRGPGFVFLMVARLLRDKGVREYAEAAKILRARYPDAEFHLVDFFDIGNPTAVSQAEVQRWQQEGILYFHGPTDDPRPFYASADGVVLPSYREGCPRTLLEAASMAKPVIASDAPGCRQVVNNSVTGFLVKIADAGDLALAMERMLLLPATEREQMGSAGREKVLKEFNENVVLARYCDVVQDILTVAQHGQTSASETGGAARAKL